MLHTAGRYFVIIPNINRKAEGNQSARNKLVRPSALRGGLAVHYRLHFLDHEDKIATTLEIGCRNDERARAFVADIEPKYNMELWQGDRLVIRVDAALDAKASR